MELETRGEEQEELLQLPLKQQQQQLQPPAPPPPVWMSQLVIPLFETGSESTAQQQSQGQQQQFETGKGWLENLVVKLNYEQYLPCSVGAPAAELVDVWARVGVGTRWLVAMEDAGCGRRGHPGGESFPPFAPD